MTQHDQWTPELVEDVLVEAARWTNRTGGLAGPGGLRSSMPEVHMTWEDRVAEWGIPEVEPDEIPEPARRPSAREAQRLNDACHWVADHIASRDLPVTAHALNAYIAAKAMRRPVRSLFRDRGVNEARGLKMARKGLAIISVALDKKGEPVWLHDANE